MGLLSLFLDDYEIVVSKLSSAVGFNEKSVKTFVTLVLAFPVAIARRRVPAGNARYAYDAGTGLLLQWLLCGPDTRHALALALLSYALLVLAPRRPSLSFLCSFAYLSAVHIYRLVDPEIPYDGVVMVEVLKLTSLAFDYRDALASGFAKSPPGPLAYVAYALFPCGFSVGPWIAFEAYDAATGAGRTGLPAPPASRALRCVALSLASLGVTLVAPAAGLRVSRLSDPAFLAHPSALYRAGYAWAAIISMRFKYYVVWYLSEAACNLAGLGFNGTGPDGQPRWDLCCNADIRGVELAQNFKEANSKWNHTVAIYLERYVYRRCGRGLFATAATFFVSAFWHGFHPGYYISFVSAAFAVQAARYLRRLLRWRFVRVDPDTGKELAPGPAKLAYDAAGVLLTSLALQYFGTPFVLLQLEPSLALWRSLGYCGHVIVAALLAASALHPARPDRSKAR